MLTMAEKKLLFTGKKVLKIELKWKYIYLVQRQHEQRLKYISIKVSLQKQFFKKQVAVIFGSKDKKNNKK